jgi:hypothetical protein
VPKACPALKGMVGKVIIVRIPTLDRDGTSLVRLHGVESNGIWVESQDFTEAMMQKFKLATSTTTLLLFIPYHAIEYIVGSINVMSLSESALGL